MTAAAGFLLVGVSLAIFLWSVPRRGRLAPYVNTRWESPVVLGSVVALVTGLMLLLFGTPNLLKS